MRVTKKFVSITGLVCLSLGPVDCSKKADPAANTATALEGSWTKSKCTPATAGDDVVKLTYTFTGNTFTSTEAMYGQYPTVTDCSGTPAIKLTRTGTFTIGAAFATANTGTKFDFTQTTYTAVAHAGGVAMANGGLSCSPTTPTVVEDVSFSVAGCTFGGPPTIGSNGAVVYGAFLIDTTVTPNKLGFGGYNGQTDDLGADTDTARPTSVNVGDMEFTKQ